MIRRMGAVVREKRAQFVVVAGDVFDSPTPDQATVSAACAAVGALAVPVYVIPGNHDHGGPGSVWEQAFFQRECAVLAPNLRVLLKPEQVEVEGGVLLPCPLLRRHDAGDMTAWLRGADLSLYGDRPRVVIAHGSVQDFGPATDEEEDGRAANQLDLSRLPAGAVDYVALGDWHGMKEVSAPNVTAWYAGTPEPDRFPRGAGNLPGHVLAVTVSRGQAARVEAVPTARLGWHDLEFHVHDEAGVASLDAALATLFQGRTGQDLLRLSLSGSLGLAAMTTLESCLETWRSRLLRVRLHSQVREAPTEEEIRLLTERTDAPLLARVAAKLWQEAEGADEEKAETARQALRLLHGALEG